MNKVLGYCNKSVVFLHVIAFISLRILVLIINPVLKFLEGIYTLCVFMGSLIFLVYFYGKNYNGI